MIGTYRKYRAAWIVSKIVWSNRMGLIALCIWLFYQAKLCKTGCFSCHFSKEVIVIILFKIWFIPLAFVCSVQCFWLLTPFPYLELGMAWFKAIICENRNLWNTAGSRNGKDYYDGYTSPECPQAGTSHTCVDPISTLFWLQGRN